MTFFVTLSVFLDRTTLVDVNTDLFPKDEYDLTRP